MRGSARMAEKMANLENNAQWEPNSSKDRSKDKITSIVAMDNGTMVEAFKHLNYCQLAKNSPVSKRFRDLVQTHRHKLSLLYVKDIGMFPLTFDFAVIKIFDKQLSTEAYNEWVIRNEYSKHAPLQEQVASTQNIPNAYRLNAYAHYKDLNHRDWNDLTTVFYALADFNDDNWPLFQHVVHLVTDPFIYIDSIYLTDQNGVLNLLTGAINSGRRLQCKILSLNLNGTGQRYISWAKDHLRCNQFYIYSKADSNRDEALLDFAVTGAQCTPSIILEYYDISKATIDFVQKFLDLENWDEYQGVQLIQSSQFVKTQDIQVLKNDYAKFLVKEERDNYTTAYAFEFINNVIGKKLQLLTKIFDDEDDWYSGFPMLSLEIKNL